MRVEDSVRKSTVRLLNDVDAVLSIAALEQPSDIIHREVTNGRH